jgi:hypothetical protein
MANALFLYSEKIYNPQISGLCHPERPPRIAFAKLTLAPVASAQEHSGARAEFMKDRPLGRGERKLANLITTENSNNRLISNNGPPYSYYCIRPSLLQRTERLEI